MVTSSRSRVSRQEFYVAMALVGLAQQQQGLSHESHKSSTDNPKKNPPLMLFKHLRKRTSFLIQLLLISLLSRPRPSRQLSHLPRVVLPLPGWLRVYQLRHTARNRIHGVPPVVVSGIMELCPPEVYLRLRPYSPVVYHRSGGRAWSKSMSPYMDSRACFSIVSWSTRCRVILGELLCYGGTPSLFSYGIASSRDILSEYCLNYRPSG
jgi:hypothetical protein